MGTICDETGSFIEGPFGTLQFFFRDFSTRRIAYDDRYFKIGREALVRVKKDLRISARGLERDSGFIFQTRTSYWQNQRGFSQGNRKNPLDRIGVLGEGHMDYRFLDEKVVSEKLPKIYLLAREELDKGSEWIENIGDSLSEAKWAQEAYQRFVKGE